MSLSVERSASYMCAWKSSEVDNDLEIAGNCQCEERSMILGRLS